MPAELGLERQTRMVRSLQRLLALKQGLEVVWIETHISFVLLCGAHAYKFKKALRTPFLDQSTLALRRRACQEELRLNRRLAPDLYLGVVSITGTPEAPELAGQGAPIDCAVQMRAFAQDGLWDRMAERGQLGPAQVDGLVPMLQRFHAEAQPAQADGRLGSPAQVRAPLVQSLDELEGLLGPRGGAAMLGPLRTWEAAAFARLAPVMARRLAQGRVRECHGDLHLGNVTLIEGRGTIFDAIDFNDDFRWIDVMSEIAFMAMDLQAHGLPRLAHRFVNGYLECSGDYDGVQVLDYYLVHRALVRAKVHALRAVQCAGATAVAEQAAAERYLTLARHFSGRGAAGAALMLTHGFSGSGKSTLTQGLLEACGAIRIRSDVERKRLARLLPLDRAGAAPDESLYAADMTAATYAQLLRLARPVLAGGYHVVLDATFLQRVQRDAARQWAARQVVRCALLDFDAAPAELRRRLVQRAAMACDASDADAAVLAAQMRVAEPLRADEEGPVFSCHASAADGGGPIDADWSAVLTWLAADQKAMCQSL